MLHKSFPSLRVLFFGLLLSFASLSAEDFPSYIAQEDCCTSDPCCPPDDSCCEPDCCVDPCCTSMLLEFRAAYFHPTGCRFDDIYGGTGIYNLEFSIQTWCDLYTWVSVGYLRESGHSIGLSTPTTIQLVPLGIGLKYMFSCFCFRPYIGAGFGATWMDIDNKTKFVHDVTDWVFGGIFKVGSLWNFCNCWFLDAFIDYTYMKKDYHGTWNNPFVYRHDGDISGFSFGLGIGVEF